MAEWRYFSPEGDPKLFACSCCGEIGIDPLFVDMLDELRHQCGFPIRISSGYRCPDHNYAVSSSGYDGPHTTGRAADLAVDRERAVIVLEKALAMPFTGIGVHQKGAGRFIHLDVTKRPTRTVWSY